VIVANVNDGTDGQTITNTAEIVAVDQTDPVPGNDSDVAVLTVQETVHTNLSKIVDFLRPDEAQTIVFTISVNGGGRDATGLVLEDKLPDGLTYDSHTATSGTTYDETTGEWNIGSLPSGATADLEITVTVDAGTSGTQITNIATVKEVDQVDLGGDPADVTISVN